jgi:polyhydroxyalkanoate synthesis regulator phasin
MEIVNVGEAEHLRDVIDERDKRYEQRFQASEKALAEAKTSIDSRLDLLNELRGGVATKPEIEALEKIIDALRGQVADLRDRLGNRDGRSAGMTAGWGILVGAVLLALAVLAAFRG